MIIFYAKDCEGCRGNHALSSMKAYCEKENIEFMERRTLFFYVFEDEANAIMDATGVKIPFFYNTETQEALEGNTFTSYESIKRLAKKL